TTLDELLPVVELTGTVKDSIGDPISGVELSASWTSGQGFSPTQTCSARDTAISSPSGDYTLKVFTGSDDIVASPSQNSPYGIFVRNAVAVSADTQMDLVLRTLTCGNGTLDPAELCDAGAANGTPSSCCTIGCVQDSSCSICGDGVLESSEQCDD